MSISTYVLVAKASYFQARIGARAGLLPTGIYFEGDLPLLQIQWATLYPTLIPFTYNLRVIYLIDIWLLLSPYKTVLAPNTADLL